ncbi:Hypothetical predicted protein [Marmota monax]|uniref:Uncharacterized protein n=1 Tax=Marmota monax TaxID=9995 RepID=A0A5E4CDS8_MARMO|nr:hypothetical protein GHT09_013080 [Marmota monax]VTJ80104.1 Hypothetical predicted protein [Marmota monax]
MPFITIKEDLKLEAEAFVLISTRNNKLRRMKWKVKKTVDLECKTANVGTTEELDTSG